MLAHGDEPGLASPLADALLLAAAPLLDAGGLRVLGAIFGAGCDGELTPDEVRGAARRDRAQAEPPTGSARAASTTASSTALAARVGGDPDRGQRDGDPLRARRARRARRSAAGGAACSSPTLGGRLLWFDPQAALDGPARLAARGRRARRPRGGRRRSSRRSACAPSWPTSATRPRRRPRAMTASWTETRSPSFAARHVEQRRRRTSSRCSPRSRASRDAPRTRWSRACPRTSSWSSTRAPASLALAQPAVPLLRRLTAPAARRYVAGWPDGRARSTCSRRGCSRSGPRTSPGSREMLLLDARGAAAPSSRSPRATRRCRRRCARAGCAALAAAGRGLRWAPGSGCPGQTAHARPAIARRLREGRRPAFPPGLRDAWLLGGSVARPARARGGRAAPRVRFALDADGDPRARAGARLRRALARAQRGRLALAPGARWPAPVSSLSRRPAEAEPDDEGADARRRAEQAGEQPSRRRARRLRRGRAGRPAAASRARPRAPDAGTSTSRGPAASMSGTSKPRERRTRLGMPSSSSRPCDQLGLGLVAARRDGHQLALGVLRPDLARALVRARPCSSTVSCRGRSSGIPQSGQKRSSSGCRVAQRGQMSGPSSATGRPRPRTSLTRAVVDQVAAHLGLVAAREADDQPLDAGPAGGEVDVGLRRVGRRARVRVVDRAELVAASSISVSRRCSSMPSTSKRSGLAARFSRRGARVTARRRARRRRRSTRSGASRARVRDDRVEQLGGDPHRRRAYRRAPCAGGRATRPWS